MSKRIETNSSLSRYLMPPQSRQQRFEHTQSDLLRKRPLTAFNTYKMPTSNQGIFFSSYF